MKLDKKYKVLLIDFNNFLWRALAAHQNLSFQGAPTGGIYGFVRMMSHLVLRYEIERVVVCHDSKPYHRSVVYPQYKMDREKQRDEAMLQLKVRAAAQCNSFLMHMGILQVWDDGWEADDIIGAYCRQRFRRFERIFVGSNDSDFYQLFSAAPNIYLCGSKGLYGIADFKRAHPGLEPSAWPRVLALMGSHNGVPGIKGVGPVTATKLILEGTTDRGLVAKYGLGLRDVRLRTELATLPFAGVEPPPRTPVPEAIEYSKGKLLQGLDPYGIRMSEDFQAAFKKLARG